MKDRIDEETAIACGGSGIRDWIKTASEKGAASFVQQNIVAQDVDQGFNTGKE